MFISLRNHWKISRELCPQILKTVAFNIMKKTILAFLIFGAVICAPVAKAEELGLTPEMIQQAQTDPEYKALVISYLKTIIMLLQEQLKVMIAQENILNKIAQNAVPSVVQPTQAQSETQIQQTMEPFNFNPQVLNTGSDLVVIIPEKFDQCSLIITDANGNKVREQSTWMTDSNGNARQVYTVNTPGQHTYSITCQKSGFDSNTKEGQFPAAE